jgi:hypothetical protein
MSASPLRPRRACQPRRRAWRTLPLALIACAGMPAGAHAAVTSFGSNLSAPATANTAENLNYAGSNIPTIINGAGVTVHVNHDGADTALWNAALASGNPTAPAGGQITQVRLKGCAEPAPGGPAPLTQVHFQDLQATNAGAFRVNVTSNPFNLPVCGQNGDANTISTFAPTNFCVSAGDYVDFNDEGGFDPKYYPSGVKYQVIGSVGGSTMDSFIRNNGTGNGSTFSPSDSSYHDGFAVNAGKELLLQATLATGPDATPLCPGGSAGAIGAKAKAAPAARASVPRQSDGASRGGAVSVAVSCHGTTVPCSGVLAVTVAGVTRKASFSLGSGRTGHFRLRFGSTLVRALRKGHGKARAQARVVLSNLSSASSTITITGGH